MLRKGLYSVSTFLVIEALLFFLSSAELLSRDSISSADGHVSATYRLQSPAPSAADLRSLYTPEQVALLEKLNRADARSLPRLKLLAIPERWDLAELRYSPLPARYLPAKLYPKLLVVDLSGQVFGGYEFGQLVRWGPVSSGKRETPTLAGFYHLNWKSPGRHSTIDPEWYMRWYFNFANSEGQAFHEYSLPGYPASHTCIRLLARDARWLYQWGDSWQLGEQPWEILQSGTPVLIVGQYQYGEPPPWRSPEWLAQGIQLPAELLP